MSSIGNPLLWGCFAIIIMGMLLVDLFIQSKRAKKNQEMTFTQSAIWSLVWVSMALLFNLGLWFYLSENFGNDVADTQALAFFTGYLIEKALAIDNVFVWLMIFGYFSVPTAKQHKILLYGILGAILLRTIMIFAGSWLISEFQWILYIFGAFLIFTGIKMAISKDEGSDLNNNKVVAFFRKKLRMTEGFHKDYFFVRQNKLLYVTPLFLVLILIELSDVVFAVDSIPAVFAITTDPFIVLTSNLFAILGLRAMYFLLANVAERFTLLKYGLAIILIFIGIKMLIMGIYHIPIGISLGVVGSILMLTMILSMWVNRQK